MADLRTGALRLSPPCLARRQTTSAIGIRLVAGLVLAAALASAVSGAGGAATASPGVIAFYASEGNRDVYTVKPGGTGIRDLGAPGPNPAFSPSGKQIAYTCHETAICIMNADGSGNREVFTPAAPMTIAKEPTWSPDGKRLAFTGEVTGNILIAAIWIVNVDGSHAHSITPTDVNQIASQPSWSPDGRWLAIDYADETRKLATGGWALAIYLVRPDGSGLHQLTPKTPTLEQQGSPSWSPDGKLVIFGQIGPGWPTKVTMGIYTIRKDGSGRKRLLQNPGDYDADPHYSPDGKQIVFWHQHHPEKSSTRWIYTMSSSGTQLHRLTAGSTPAWGITPKG
jgi:Tol biopolymer transport system component